MKAKLLAMAVVLAFSGAAIAGEMSSGSSNPAEKGAPKTPKQPNETQPGQSSAADKDTKGMKKGMKEDRKGMKSDKMGMKGESSNMGMKGESSNMGNPAEKGNPKTPSQPNETQPGTGSVKK